MRRLTPLLILALIPATAHAADRTYAVGSFERVRVEGPFEVTVATGASPAARAEGDKALIDQLDVTVSGGTLTVRLGANGWGETRASTPRQVARVTLATPRLAAATLSAGARVTITRMAAPRVDLAITGAGSLSVDGIDTDQLATSVIGSGALTLAGRAARARLMVNGPGTIQAPALTTGDLIARIEGNGEIATTARFTAQVTTTGLGKVTVLGPAKCVVKAVAGGPVQCGGN